MVLSLLLCLLVYFTYLIISHFKGFDKDDDEENKILNRLYFTMTTFSSTGYGDIAPNSDEIKIISMILQFILVIAMLGGILEFS